MGENLQKFIAVVIFIYVSHHKNDSWHLFAVFKTAVSFASVNFSVSTQQQIKIWGLLSGFS